MDLISLHPSLWQNFSDAMKVVLLIFDHQSECRPRVCVGGNTSRPVNLGKDLCGKCGGKNGCVDCAGVVNGKKIWNSCQQCLDPDDKLFFKCPKIIDVNELVVNGDESTKLTLTVAGMKSNIRCYLEAKDSR